MYLSVIFLILILTLNYFEYKKIAAAKGVRFKFVFFPLFVIALAPISPAVLIVFLIYRHLINVILIIKYGGKYGGLLDGVDVAHAVDGQSITHGLWLIQYNPKSAQSFYDTVSTGIAATLARKLKRNTKFFGVMQEFMGYFFVIKDEVTPSDGIKKLDVIDNPKNEITEFQLMQLMSSTSRMPLPKNGTGFWDVFIGTQPIAIRKDDQSDDQYWYPVMLRLHHSLADGFDAFAGIAELFGDKDKNNNKHENSRKVHSSIIRLMVGQMEKVVASFKYYMKYFRTVLVSPSLIIVNSLILEKMPHSLHGSQLCNRKLLCFHFEDSPKYLQAIKRIKNKMPKCTFQSVWLSAITATFADYFKQQSKYTPEYVLAMVPYQAEALQLRNWNLKDNREKKVQCRNSLAFAVYKLPVRTGCDNANLVNILQSTTEAVSRANATSEIQINYWTLATVFSILPKQILQLLTEMTFDATVTISNLPFPPNLTVLDGLPVARIVGWPANRSTTGICLMITSYGDQLQLSIVVDKVLISDHQEVQAFIDRVGEYILRIDQAVNDISCNNQPST